MLISSIFATNTADNANIHKDSGETGLWDALTAGPSRLGCPSAQASVEAQRVWLAHFEAVCKVDAEDLPDELQDYSQAVHMKSHDGCAIALDLGEDRGSLRYIAKPPAGASLDKVMDEGWDGTSLEWIDSSGQPHKPCEYIRQGTPKKVSVPQDKVSQVLAQLRTRYGQDCGAVDEHELALLKEDADSVPAKEVESPSPGQIGYSMDLQVTVEGEDTSALRVKIGADTGMEEEQEGQSTADSEAVALGNWTVLEVKPAVCCLCNKCSNPAKCSVGEEELDLIPKLVEKSHTLTTTSKNTRDSLDQMVTSLLKSTSDHLEHRTGSNYTQVEIPPRGSPEELKPPPGSDSHTLTGTSEHDDFQFAFGDNFHSTVLPRRTSEDHAKVWAQSRALVELSKEEGVKIPEAYHFYDNDVHAGCWRVPYSQAKCGSCWAFASLGALEKQVCMRSAANVTPSLSREHLVRCSEQNFGCSGGNGPEAYKDLMEIGGVWSTDCLPYDGAGKSKHCPAFEYGWFDQAAKGKTGRFTRIDQEIADSCGDHTRYTNRPPIGAEWDMPFRMMYEKRMGDLPNQNDPRIQRFKANFQHSRARDRVAAWSLYSEEAMKTALLKYGAIYASFKVNDDFKRKPCKDGCYPPGTVYGADSWEPEEDADGTFVQSTCSGCGSGHAVQIIGWGVELLEWGLQVPYWTIENSWGPAYGNVIGLESDPFTTLHPMHAESECMLAGTAEAEESVSRKGVDVEGGPPDGFHLHITVGGKTVLRKEIPPKQRVDFQEMITLLPGKHIVNFTFVALNHPTMSGVATEAYSLRSVKLRCRGRGYGYSFSTNDTKAVVSWAQKTRAELKEEASKIMPFSKVPTSVCPAKCQQKTVPCMTSIYKTSYCVSGASTEQYFWRRYKSQMTNCSLCEKHKELQQLAAIAMKELNNDTTYLKWFNLMTLALDAPDKGGFLRQRGSCKVSATGFGKGAALTASFTLTMPNGADGKGGCNHYHSAPYVKGRFVHAPLSMESGSTATVRCSIPDAGEVTLKCANGVLTVVNHTCVERVPMKAMGFHRFLRGKNYHGIESSGVFAIAEMSNLKNVCPTTGWSKWSECSAEEPCKQGMQSRSRTPLPPLTITSPACQNFEFQQQRPCVGAGFCSKVLMKMVKQASSIPAFLTQYAFQSASLPQSTAGAHAVDSVHLDCVDAKFWCSLTTGSENCALYFDGHFQIKESGYYNLLIKSSDGRGELRFNPLGTTSVRKHTYLATSDKGLQIWMDSGIHHRRRRTGTKQWSPVHSYYLEKGTYFGQFLRSGWSSCPTFQMTLERSFAKFVTPKLYPDAKSTTWSNMWGAVPYWATRDRSDGGRRRRRGIKTAGETEIGDASEIVIRDEYGGKVFVKKPITRLAYNAEELYTALDLDKNNPCQDCEHKNVEMVLRSTILIPSDGGYTLRLNMDFTPEETSAMVQPIGRRRRRVYRTVVAKVGKQEVRTTTRVQTPEVVIAHQANEAGGVTFEASTLLYARDGIHDKFVLPSRIALQIKKHDVLHGKEFEFGRSTKYVSPIEALRGDDDARISYPDISNPLDQQLTISSFKPLMPDDLLIGRRMSNGFLAHAEGRADAGCCLSLQARVPHPRAGGFAGLAVNLCDEDGTNIVELAKITAGQNNNTFEQTQLGFVHTEYNHPTHLELVRDPLNIELWKVSYRPDNSMLASEPFKYQIKAAVNGFVGADLEVGVTMTTRESFRVSEFYNVTIETCPSACNERDIQVYCGNYTTACGNTLSCGTCPGGSTCANGLCMSCPGLDQTEVEALECSSIRQVCTNPSGKKVQVDMKIGDPPSPNHVCSNNKWVCQGKAVYHYLAEGMDCGTITNECDQLVEIGDCSEDQVCMNATNTCEARKGDPPPVIDVLIDLGQQPENALVEYSEKENQIQVEVDSVGKMVKKSQEGEKGRQKKHAPIIRRHTS